MFSYEPRTNIDIFKMAAKSTFDTKCQPCCHKSINCDTVSLNIGKYVTHM